ncbi:required for drug-induced death protein 1 [Pungitius pungitius]|uniref:required for drug-induced death protein 1 n=1 Tax=Pungitius pungitius TaxID=134920 RepID=UPI002E106EA1
MGTRRSEEEKESTRGMGAQEEEAAPPTENNKQHKTSKEVFFSVLPDRYDPLIEEEEEEEGEGEGEEEERRRRKEEKKRRKKKKYKKYRKNVGRALRLSWRCLLLGLQSMASVCSAPAGAASLVVTEVPRWKQSMMGDEGAT